MAQLVVRQVSSYPLIYFKTCTDYITYQINELRELERNVSNLTASAAAISEIDSDDDDEIMAPSLPSTCSSTSFVDIDNDEIAPDLDMPMLESESCPSSPFSGAWSAVDDEVDAEIMATDITDLMSNDYGPSLSSMSSSGSSLATYSSTGSSYWTTPNPPLTIKASESVRTRTLLSYFTQETTVERAERNTREMEELQNSREQRELEEARSIAFREAKRRMHDRARQQVRRDKLRGIKIENGWLPGQKRVSH